MMGRKHSNQARPFLNSVEKAKDPCFRALPEGIQLSVEEQASLWTDLSDVYQLSQEGVQILQSSCVFEGPCMDQELDL